MSDKPTPFKVGNKHLFRTVTHYLTGEIVDVVGDFILITNAAWIADTKRYADIFVKGFTPEAEIEPYPDGMVVPLNMNSLIDAPPWEFDLPRKQQ